MGKIVLITGGARSGKSTYAETRALELESEAGQGSGILYVATCIADDEEMKDRVQRHRSRRPGSWRTLEAPEEAGRRILETAGSMPGLAGVLLDCVTLLVSQCMARCLKDWDAISPAEADLVEIAVNAEVDGLISAAEGLPCPLVLVTNEIGMSLVPEYASGRLFRDAAGRANQVLAAAAGEVVFCISGIPVRIKPSRSD
jgi:adenosylcobinamide kinase / adenosylcobinamide-phosphate guanylyltransferase